jgi:cyclic-di-GMP phosphodiesterase TipF (flagellum assembly factor)
MPPPIAPGHTRLSAVAAAVAGGRLDTHLQSIIGLADHQLHHYEIIIRPRDERGAPLTLVTHDPQLARTGLNPLIDSARLARAVQVCHSLAEQGQRTCVLAAASGESLSTDRFLDEIADAYRQREALAGELVLTFALADVKNFGGNEWRALTDMRDLGFRFALEAVTDLDYEFSALAAAGFAFVKVEASRLQRGLPGPDGVTQGADISHGLHELGLAVIATGIADEAARSAVLDLGVSLGEGTFFGTPRAISVDVADSGTAAA